MDGEEHDNLLSNTRHTKATAYMAAFTIAVSVLLAWGLWELLSEAKERVETNTEDIRLNKGNISDLGFRVGSVERDLLRAEDEREETKRELLQTLREMRSDITPIKEYVIEEKAKEAERERLNKIQ